MLPKCARWVTRTFPHVDSFWFPGEKTAAKKSPEKSAKKSPVKTPLTEMPLNWQDCKAKNINLCDSNVKFRHDDQGEQSSNLMYLVNKAIPPEEEGKKDNKLEFPKGDLKKTKATPTINWAPNPR